MDKEISSVSSDKLIKSKADLKCAPGTDFSSGSCIELNVLVEMAKAFNQENSHNQIKLHSRLETLNPKKYKKYLLDQFNKKLTKCSSQICWTKQSFINKMNELSQIELTKFTFRPEGPKAQFEWLNTLHLNDVMLQYEKIYPDFKFLGAVPMDFDKLPDLDLKDINIKEYVNDGITKFGIIFNLDEHWQGGSHWVAGYFDVKKGVVYYYDSYGIAPESRVRKLMRRFANFSEQEYKIRADAKHNIHRHQFGNSECGMYSLNLILELLEGREFEDICKDNIKDERVNKLRPIFFYNVDKDFSQIKA
jgi:hypothetical protein